MSKPDFDEYDQHTLLAFMAEALACGNDHGWPIFGPDLERICGHLQGVEDALRDVAKAIREGQKP